MGNCVDTVIGKNTCVLRLIASYNYHLSCYTWIITLPSGNASITTPSQPTSKRHKVWIVSAWVSISWGPYTLSSHVGHLQRLIVRCPPTWRAELCKWNQMRINLGSQLEIYTFSRDCSSKPCLLTRLCLAIFHFTWHFFIWWPGWRRSWWPAWLWVGDVRHIRS